MTFSVFLGQVAGGLANAFCLCGDPTDRSAAYGIHAAFEGCKLRLLCPDCGARYAPELARLAGIRPVNSWLKRALKAQRPARWQVIELAEDVEWPDEFVVDDPKPSPSNLGRFGG